MKKILIPILFLIQLQAYSQFWRTLSYGLSFSYDRCYRNIISDNYDYKAYLDSLEKFGSGYNAGLHLMKPINKHLSLETGAFFYNHTYGTDKIHYPDSVYSLDYNIFFTDASWHHTYKSINIPIGLRYYFNGGRVSVFTGTGFIPAILTTHIEKSNYYNGDELVLKQSYYKELSRRFDIGWYINIGTSIFPSYNSRIDLIMRYKRSLLPVMRNNYTDEFLESFGFSIGISQTI
ncbi:MAG: outer membrane beta-barrel protein [Bacteroidota bacterium]